MITLKEIVNHSSTSANDILKLEKILEKRETEYHFPEKRRYQLSICKSTGKINACRVWTIVDQRSTLTSSFQPDNQISLADAIKHGKQKHTVVGGTYSVRCKLRCLEATKSDTQIKNSIIRNESLKEESSQSNSNSSTTQAINPKIALLNLNQTTTKILAKSKYNSVDRIKNSEKKVIAAVCKCSEDHAQEIIHRAQDLARMESSN